MCKALKAHGQFADKANDSDEFFCSNSKHGNWNYLAVWKSCVWHCYNKDKGILVWVEITYGNKDSTNLSWQAVTTESESQKH